MVATSRTRLSRTCACSATCTSETRSRFAQGHDARMVSLLVKQVVATEIDVEVAAQRVVGAGGSAALVNKLHRAVANAEAKADRKQTKPAQRPVSRKIRAKVGRWEYEGTLANRQTDGKLAFFYQTKGGATRVTTKFTSL